MSWLYVPGLVASNSDSELPSQRLASFAMWRFMLEIKELYWAAGFIEGEGNFSVRSCNRLRIEVGQNSPECLERLQILFGRGVVSRKHDSIFHRWTLFGNHAASVMMTLFPLMSTRRQMEIRTCLRTWREHRNTKGRFRTHCKRGHPWVPENIYTKGKVCCLPCLRERSGYPYRKVA